MIGKDLQIWFCRYSWRVCHKHISHHSIQYARELQSKDRMLVSKYKSISPSALDRSSIPICCNSWLKQGEIFRPSIECVQEVRSTSGNSAKRSYVFDKTELCFWTSVRDYGKVISSYMWQSNFDGTRVPIYTRKKTLLLAYILIRHRSILRYRVTICWAYMSVQWRITLQTVCFMNGVSYVLSLWDSDTFMITAVVHEFILYNLTYVLMSMSSDK